MGAAQSVQNAESIATKSAVTEPVAACPVDHKSVRHAAAASGGGCPVDHKKIAAGKGMSRYRTHSVNGLVWWLQGMCFNDKQMHKS